MKYFILFLWVELVCLFAFGCAGPRERRGDWMEHLNYRQFTSQPLSVHWDRHNYYSLEELKVMWEERYQVAIQNLERGADE